MLKPLTGLYWRQFLKLDNIDVCALLNGENQIDFLKSAVEEYINLFPGLPKRCPIEKKKYSAKNVRFIRTGEISNRNYSHSAAYLTPKDFPNGIYRNTVRFYTDYDPEGFMIYWHVQMNQFMGDDRL